MADILIEIKEKELAGILLQLVKDTELGPVDPHMVSFRLDTNEKLIATIRCKPVIL